MEFKYINLLFRPKYKYILLGVFINSICISETFLPRVFDSHVWLDFVPPSSRRMLFVDQVDMDVCLGYFRGERPHPLGFQA